MIHKERNLLIQTGTTFFLSHADYVREQISSTVFYDFHNNCFLITHVQLNSTVQLHNVKKTNINYYEK